MNKRLSSLKITSLVLGPAALLLLFAASPVLAAVPLAQDSGAFPPPTVPATGNASSPAQPTNPAAGASQPGANQSGSSQPVQHGNTGGQGGLGQGGPRTQGNAGGSGSPGAQGRAGGQNSPRIQGNSGTPGGTGKDTAVPRPRQPQPGAPSPGASAGAATPAPAGPKTPGSEAPGAGPQASPRPEVQQPTPGTTPPGNGELQQPPGSVQGGMPAPSAPVDPNAAPSSPVPPLAEPNAVPPGFNPNLPWPTAKLRVRVIDGRTQKPLSGAEVVVIETEQRVRTDKNGYTPWVDAPVFRNPRLFPLVAELHGQLAVIAYKNGYRDSIHMGIRMHEGYETETTVWMYKLGPGDTRIEPILYQVPYHRLYLIQLADRFRSKTQPGEGPERP
ncbi:hypothetical protein LLE49_11625 [Alicyclobacillus tolerans]|uniref:hypothetical protein n=1 Tax=Alicyclobacillus tolerans TaxID=90970 RepID=UPI001F28C8CC|nr:hypothetical protein [Alicyclobacillus tolerans]MCF8565367.1 hypothetical protein [Alicyclobacillus tolerans]